MRLHLPTFVGLLFAGFVLLSCDDSQPAAYRDQGSSHDPEFHPPVDLSAFSAENYPRVDGSTSAHPLAVIVACKILGCSYGWDNYHDGTTRAVAYSSNSAFADSVNNLVTHNGTHGSYENLISDETDLILAARKPSELELALARGLGVELEIEPVARDAFVFIAHENNPVYSLSVKQVQGIYTGDITNWSQVEGPDTSIIAFQRNESSGSQELMLSMVMDTLEMIDAPDLVAHGMMGPYLRLPHEPFGLAYTVYFFQIRMAPNDEIKMLALDEIFPKYETIREKEYPLWTEVYAVVRKNTPQTANAVQLRNWLMTEEGQKTIKESGYVSLAIP